MHDENENDVKNDLNAKDGFLVNIMNSVRKAKVKKNWKTLEKGLPHKKTLF